jgi:tetratricopeptide (TPR) repeat protein
MRRHHFAWTLGIAGTLLPQLGCWSLPVKAPEFKSADQGLIFEKRLDGPTSASDKARACMATGAALEADGNKLPPADPNRQTHEREAIKQYLLARKHSNSMGDRVARRLAVLYDRQGDYAKAELEYARALKASPRDSDLHNDYGYFLYQQGKWTEAEHSFRKALEANAANQRAQVNLGMTIAQQGRAEEAFGVFNKCLSPAEAYANLGYIHSTQGKREQAVHAYQQAVQLNPNLKQAHAALEWLQGGEAERETQESLTRFATPTSATGQRPSFNPTGSRQSEDPDAAVQRLSSFRQQREHTERSLTREREALQPEPEEEAGARATPSVKPITVLPR